MESLTMEKAGLIILRKATAEDRDILFQWRNEKLCRENSLNTEEVPYETHCAWFEKRLQDKDTLLYVAIMGVPGDEAHCRGYVGEAPIPVGQVRVDIEDMVGKISYSVASEFRGRGFGQQILASLESEPQVCRRVQSLEAEVKRSNPASGHCFEKLGYEKAEKGEILIYTKQLDK